MRTAETDRIFGVLLVVLVAASVVGWVLGRRYRGSAAIENVNARIRAWWVLILVGGGALMAGRWAVIALFVFISAAALREFVPRGPGLWIGLAAIPLQYALVSTAWFAQHAVAVDVAMVAAFCVVRRQAGWGVLLCVVYLSHVPALMMLRMDGMLMLYVVLIAQASDVLQYLWGKLAGRHAIAPVISPSKTVEGLAGALMSCAMLGLVLAPGTPFTPWQSAMVAVIVTLLGFLGGLLMSAIKRRRGIKDWGRIISGHGGMLDRVDSLCLSAPVFYHLTAYLVGS